MLKHLLTIETAFHFTKPLYGILLRPTLTEDFMNPNGKGIFTGLLIFPDGKRQEVSAHFIQAHYSRRSIGLPAWTTECFLEGIEAVPEGTELWWDA